MRQHERATIDLQLEMRPPIISRYRPTGDSVDLQLARCLWAETSERDRSNDVTLWFFVASHPSNAMAVLLRFAPAGRNEVNVADAIEHACDLAQVTRR